MTRNDICRFVSFFSLKFKRLFQHIMDNYVRRIPMIKQLLIGLFELILIGGVLAQVLFFLVIFGEMA